MKIVVLGGAGVTTELGVPDGSALPKMYKPQRGKADTLDGYYAAMEGIREMMVPTALAPGAVRPRLAIAEVVEQLSAAVPGGVSCFTLNIDGLWPEACAVHGTVQEDNVVLTGTVPAEVEEERKVRYAKLATALDDADRILICGMSGRTLSINDVLKHHATGCNIWWVDPDHSCVGLPLRTAQRLQIKKVTGTVRISCCGPRTSGRICLATSG
jgi:NAD-dependent SIR2 family protein deacetylase